MRSGSDNKYCLKFFNGANTFPFSIKYANQEYFCSISGNSISACGNDHPAWPRTFCLNIYIYIQYILY
jgi:hypothetical protein